MTNSGYWIERKSARGYPYRVWRCKRVPKIDQQFLDCSIYLYESREAAKAGQKFGGSGCLVCVGSQPIWDSVKRVTLSFPPHVYAVSNAHVARKYPIIRLNTVAGDTDILEPDRDQWIQHPDGDDLMVAPLDLPPDKYGYAAINSESFVCRDDTVTSVGAGDDTFMVGRFINHAGTQRNTPSLRFGSIAMLPFEKVKLGNHMQEAFLVEMRSISGFSGSPVFVYRPTAAEIEIPPTDYDSAGVPITRFALTVEDLMGEIEFLGIDCGHVPKFEKVVNGAGTPHPQGWRIDTNTGMAVVIPAWRLMDLLNTPRLVMQRKEKDEQHKREQEQEETISLDVEKPEAFTKESYQDALRRASRKVSESKDSDK